MPSKAICMPCMRHGVIVPQWKKQDKSIALIATYYKGWNNAGDRPVPCIISTYQRAYGSRTTDRPYVLEVMDA